MANLSISRAWDGTKATLQRDGKLITTVALALIGVPSAIAAFIDPSTGMAGEPQGLGGALLAIVVGVIGLIGQLAIIRLVVGPAVSVGDAIRHGTGRALPYIGSALLVLLGFVLLAIPFVIAMSALGMDFEPPVDTIPAAAWLLMLLFFVVAVYLAVRLILASPVAGNETLGPVGILRRSWALSAGHAGRLIGFVLLFILGVGIAFGALSLATGSIVGLLFGPVHPMNASALVVGLVSGLGGAIATVLFVVMITHIYMQLTGAEGTISVPSSH
jgi:hypothetical protein